MSTDRLAALTTGVLGRFWTLDKDPAPSGQLKEKDARPGHLQVVAGVVRVKTQTPPRSLAGWHEAFTAMAEGSQPAPRWIFGITELGTVVIPVVSGEGIVEAMGAQVSTRTFRSPAVAVGVGEPFGPRVTRLAVRLPFAAWAGLNPMSGVGHFDDQQRWTGLDIQLRGTDDLACGRVGSIDVLLRGTWNREKDEDQEDRTWIETGLQVITESKRPREHTDHVEVAMSVQDLLSLAYDRFLPASTAHVVLEGNKDPRSRTWFYHHDLVDSPDRSTNGPNDPHQRRPLFELSDLGGPRAVSRWVVLNRQYPDAANAVRVRYRTPTNPTRRIIELGAAIEQYVRTNAAQGRSRSSPPAWTKEAPWGAALARHAGAEFANFVGDPQRWGEFFNAAYVSEKHYTGTRYPVADLVRLSSSAQILLICELLNRAAGSHQPSRKLLTDHRVAQLGEQLRPLISTWQSPPKKRRR